MDKKKWIYISIAVLTICYLLKLILLLLHSTGFFINSFFFNENILPYLSSDMSILSGSYFLNVFADVLKLNPTLLRFLSGIFNLLVAVLFTLIFKRFFIQSSMAVEYEFLNILKSGVLVYAAFMLLIILFFLSVVGFGVSFFIVLITNIMIISGKIGLAIYIGQLILKENIFLNFISGQIILYMLVNIPFVGWFFKSIIIPIISLGILVIGLNNFFITKRHYSVKRFGNNTIEKHDFDREYLYNIIIDNKNNDSN